MATKATPELNAERRHEIVVWFEAHRESLPEPVKAFFKMHLDYLAAEGNLQRKLTATVRELRRAMGIVSSSERRKSGSPLSDLPSPGKGGWTSERERLEQQADRSDRLSNWHVSLVQTHVARAKRIKERLERMAKNPEGAPLDEIPPLEDFEPTEEQRAENEKNAKLFVAHLQAGDGPDPAFLPVHEALMPADVVFAEEHSELLKAEVPQDLAQATVLKTTTEFRERYDFAVTVSRIELEVEKKILEDADGQRYVVTASTSDWGPPRYAVTWNALGTLAVLVGQFAMPFNRLATLVSTSSKRFTAGSLGRLLHYVAERFQPIYLELFEQLADSDLLAGDDTTCRVLEVAKHFREEKANAVRKPQPPWAGYRTPKEAEESVRNCEALEKARKSRREDGDREAIRTADEKPSLGVLIGQHLQFESPRRDGDGPKKALNTTVVSGRSVADDPRSLIVFYRSHLGSCGNLFEALLDRRDPGLREVRLQGDLSSSNSVKRADLHTRFRIRPSGCTSHARRPFAIHEDDDTVHCQFMLHLFKGLAIHEQRLDVHGRNRENVTTVRQHESRQMWELIKELAQTMTERWSKETVLGKAARYIIKHFEELTAYLDDPRMEPTNNLRERMLRTEKLIEGSSMFRKSLEGRFVLDVVRTVLQTAVASGAPAHDYVVSVLRESPEEIARHPENFTPRAWVARNAAASTTSPRSP